MNKGIIEKIKTFYHNSPEIKIFHPFHIDDGPDPIPVEFHFQGKIFNGFVLPNEDNDRVISSHGSSLHISIPASFAKFLQPKCRVYPLRIEDRLGILVLKSEGTEIIPEVKRQNE